MNRATRWIAAAPRLALLLAWMTCLFACRKTDQGQSAAPAVVQTPAAAALVKDVGMVQELAGNKGGFVGRVTDKSGAPLPGVLIRWCCKCDRSDPGDMTATDADGRYALTTTRLFKSGETMLGAIPGPPLATAWKFGAASGPPGKPATADFSLDAGGWLGVTVVDAAKKPLSGILVTLSSNAKDPQLGAAMLGSYDECLATDAQGKVRIERLPSMPMSVLAAGKGYTSIAQANVALNREITLTLPPAGTIVGRAFDEAGKPVGKFKVYLDGDGTTFDQNCKGVEIADPQGRFTIGDLFAGGKYRVRIAAENLRDSPPQDVAAARKELAKEAVFHLQSAAPITIETVDADTLAPIPNEKIYRVVFGDLDTMFLAKNMDIVRRYWARLDERFTSIYEDIDRSETDAAGKTVFQENGASGAIFIKSDSYRHLCITPQDREQYKVAKNHYRVPLKKGIAVVGVAYGAGRKPLADELVTLSLGNEFQNAKTDASGNFAFKGLSPGEGTLMIGVGTFGFDPPLMAKPITVSADPVQRINLGDDLGPYAITGTILDGGLPAKYVDLTLTNQFGWEYASFNYHPSGNGKYVFAGLKPGNYNLHLLLKYGHERERQLDEDLVIAGDVQRDFSYGTGNKIYGKPIYPKDMVLKTRAAFSSCVLVYAGLDSPERRKEHLDSNVYMHMELDHIEGRGRAKGEYYVHVGDQYYLIELHPRGVAKKYKIDNLDHDQDLGDVVISAQ